MSASLDDLSQRLHNARESLDTELKPWHDPSTDGCKAEIAKTCMALRNNNGGFLIFGIRDDGTSDDRKCFDNVRQTFSSDAIHDIVSKCASERFELTVHYIERDGLERVMIEVPSGVRIPVRSRIDLPKKGNSEAHEVGSLIRKDEVYVRTLNANGRPSTAPATASDWPQLMEICFNNREADIGDFLRRHLSGLNRGSQSNSLANVILEANEPSPTAKANAFLEDGYKRYQEARTKFKPQIPECGIREVAVVIIGDFERREFTNEFIWRLSSVAPNYSGWRPWAGYTEKSQDDKVYYLDEGMDALTYVTEIWHFFAFSRIEESGRFYFLEGLHDDLMESKNKLKPGTHLEFVNETARVTEIIAVALKFAQEFCGKDSKNELSFAFRWRGLQGRILSTWAHVNRGYSSSRTSEQDEIVRHAVIPVALAPETIGLHVENIMKGVFRIFGSDFDSSVIQDIVKKRLAGQI